MARKKMESKKAINLIMKYLPQSMAVSGYLSAVIAFIFFLSFKQFIWLIVINIVLSYAIIPLIIGLYVFLRHSDKD
ncbi:MAG: hypothetical protein JJT94_01570 [Bernardetiaceae bacterium]|nr:hypothetical protein [Bernardetiaceae bacterium]